jgi:hypothetical protein
MLREQLEFRQLTLILGLKYLSQTPSRNWWQNRHFISIANYGSTDCFFAIQPHTTGTEHFCKVATEFKNCGAQNFVNGRPLNFSVCGARSLSRSCKK